MATSAQSGSDFVYSHTNKMNTNISSNNLNLVIGILTAALTGNVWYGLVSTIAQYYISSGRTTAYWYEVYSRKTTSSSITVKIQNIYYEGSTYSNYIDTVTTRQLYSAGPR